jgi:hypothetical protein
MELIASIIFYTTTGSNMYIQASHMPTFFFKLIEREIKENKKR